MRRIETTLRGPARLDAALTASLADIGEGAPSRSRVQALVKGGHVEMAGALVTDPSRRVADGEAVVVTLPDPVAAKPAPQDIPLHVLHEDDALIVVDKPVGMVVHPGAGVHDGTLVNALLHHCGATLSGIGGVARPGIVHRLDRDTSGVMVVAKSDHAHRLLAAQFADHGRNGPLRRAYEALVWGEPTPPAGRIDAPLGRDPRDRTRRAVGTGNDAREAITHYRALEPLFASTRIECRLETGRTHQIRVHMAHAGHPLLGDRVYGASHASKANRLPDHARAALGQLRGQALHARSLTFEHPETGAPLTCEAPPPPAYQALLDALRHAADDDELT